MQFSAIILKTEGHQYDNLKNGTCKREGNLNQHFIMSKLNVIGVINFYNITEAIE